MISGLKEEKVPYDARICSAHRTPDELDALLRGNYSVIIAGAGLAAHLPGVCASKSILPVIGVPVSNNYQGLDSLLSIMQMPPGIPVLSVGVDKGREAAKMAALMHMQYKNVHLFLNEKDKAAKKAIDILKEFNVPYEINPEFRANSLNISFVTLNESAKDDSLSIYVPINDGSGMAEASLNLLRMTSNGLWVGLNRGENAALAAVEILAITDMSLRQKIIAYRKKHAEKVKDDNMKVKSK
ncbi:AIR carboxylase family protein [Candidatus Woesearchaeota archaeon]|nr:AIR carboxylase family protein [Candidatus Woesearchaeota archaeon]